MPDLHVIEEEAARYVLGELSPGECRRFEAHLEQSGELRAHVRQLEEGAVALALATPRRQPPKEIWAQVEQVLERETNPRTLVSVFRTRFWRSGWAVAAACLAGWVLSVLYLHQTEVSGKAPAPVVTEVQVPPISLPTEPSLNGAAEPTRPPVVVNNTVVQLLQAKAEEVGALRRQVAGLSNRLTHLSQALSHQQALSSAPGQFRFFQLTPDSGMGVHPGPLSTNLQQALFLAVAREMGWLGPAASTQMTGSSGGSEASANPPDSSQRTTNQAPVEFVDLRQRGSKAAQSTLPPREPEPSPLASASTGSVPGFVSGTNAILAFDSSVTPSGTALSFWSTTSSGQNQPLGTTTLGDNPLVVTVPLSAGDGQGGNLTVLAEGPGGASNVFQFSTSAGSPP